MEPRGAGRRAVCRIRPLCHRNGAVRLHQPLPAMGPAGGRALRLRCHRLGSVGPHGPSSRRAGRRRPGGGAPWAVPGRRLGCQLALDDPAGGDLPRGLPGRHPPAAVARGLVADRFGRGRRGHPRPARGAGGGAGRGRLHPWQGPLCPDRPPPAHHSAPGGAGLRRLQPLPAPHVAVWRAAQHARPCPADRRPGGLLRVHHPGGGGGHGVVYAAPPAPGCWPSRA